VASPEQVARLEALSDRTSLSKPDMIRDALRLYEYLVKMMLDGHKVSLSKDGKSETLVLFNLPMAEDNNAATM
jgi:hypothetical protein